MSSKKTYLIAGFVTVSLLILWVFQGTDSLNYGQIEDKDLPQVVISAPKSVRVGSLIAVDVSESNGTGFDFKVLPQPKDLRVDSSGKVIYCGTGDKHTEFLFIISCAKGGKSDIGLHRVKITRSSDASTNISDLVVDLLDNVRSKNKVLEASLLGQSFSSIATLIENGSLSTPNEIITATAKSNIDALGDELGAWKPFLDGLIEEFDKMSVSNKLSTPGQHSSVWREVANALKNMG